MKTLFLPVVLALTALSPAQDRASAETFITRFYQASAESDIPFMMAALDPTLIVRTSEGLTNYAYYKAIADKEKPRPKSAKPLPAAHLVYDRVDIVGERAIVDYTVTGPEKGAKPGKIHVVLTWRDGGWKFWRVDAR